MTSRSINLLIPEMQTKVVEHRRLCKEQGVSVLYYCTERTLQEQAVLYRQSNSSAEIDKKVMWLNANGYHFLADIIFDVGPQKTTGWKTNAAPGESFHNYREAVDGVPVVNGKPVWNYTENPEAWDIYGSCAKQLGLVWGGDWTSRDLPHLQLRKGVNPLKEYSPDIIKTMLIENGLL